MRLACSAASWSTNLLALPALGQQVVPAAFQLAPLGGLALGVLVLFDQGAELQLLLLVAGGQPAAGTRHLVQSRRRSAVSASWSKPIDLRSALRQLLQDLLDDRAVRALATSRSCRLLACCASRPFRPDNSSVEILKSLGGVATIRRSRSRWAFRLWAWLIVSASWPPAAANFFSRSSTLGQRAQFLGQRRDPRLQGQDLVGVGGERRRT